MRVHYERSGGFAGPAMKQTFSIDTTDLATHEASELRRLVHAADLPGLARAPATSSRGQARDQFHYRLTVEDDDQRHSVVVSDPDVPEQVQALIDGLKDRSQKDSP